MKDNCNNESIYNKSSLIWNEVFEYNTTIIMTLFWKYVSFLKNGIKVKEILTTYLKNGVKMGWKLQKKKKRLPTERSLPFTLGYRKSKFKKNKTFSSKASLNV